MHHVQFGTTGLRVSCLALGTMTFGGQCDEAQSFAILERAAEAGITFLDTADVYPAAGKDSVGRTEEILGRWLDGRRHDFVVATKCGNRVGPNPWDRGTSRRHVLDAIDASLRRLRTDYVDLYQVHFYDASTPLDETLEAFDAVLRSGKARYIGCSNLAAYQVAQALGRSEARGLARFASLQPRYNLLFRTPEVEQLPLCEAEGLAVIPYNPLAGGLLTGKHRRGTPEPGSRFDVGRLGDRYRDRYWGQVELDAVEQVGAIAADAGVSPAELAIGWVLANPAVTAPLLGATRPDQLDAAIAAVERPLDADVKARLDEATVALRGAEMRP